MDSRNDNLKEKLSADLFKEKIVPSLKAADYINGLPKTSAFYYSIFRNERTLALNLLRKLLGSAALGEWEQAESIYKLFPDLLTCRGTIYHPNRTYEEGKAPVAIPVDVNPGRYKYVNHTAWQIALMNEEYEEAKLMGKFMTEEEKQRQFAEIFPDGKIINYHWDLEEAKRLLRVVFDEVIKDPRIDGKDLSKMSDATRKAQQALYDYVKPKAAHKIGLVFDANLYVEALGLYEEKIGAFDNWSRRSFWNIKVEEWLAGCLGTGYLRPHAQGVGNDLRRSGCVLANNSSYFAFRSPVDSIPGSHFFVGYYGGRMVARGGACEAGGLSTFSKLVSSKNENRDKIYAAIFANESAGLSNLLK